MYKDDWDIQKRVEEHVKYIQETEKYKGTTMFVCAANGSMNYDLFDESSDVDTKMLVFPKADDLFLGRKPVNNVEILPNDEHCTLKDIREYFRIFRKANINFLEILCSDYYYVNPQFKDEWSRLQYHVNDIANMNPNKILSSSLGMAREKASKILHDSPANHALIEKYGYVAKELQHILRLYCFVNDYTNDVPFSEAIHVLDKPMHDLMMKIKRYENVYRPEQAQRLANEFVGRIERHVKNVTLPNCESGVYHLPQANDKMDKWLDDFLVDIMKKYLRKEL